MDSRDLLQMTLHDISDVLLQRMCEKGKSECKVTLPGQDEQGKRVTLTVELCYDN